MRVAIHSRVYIILNGGSASLTGAFRATEFVINSRLTLRSSLEKTIAHHGTLYLASACDLCMETLEGLLTSVVGVLAQALEFRPTMASPPPPMHSLLSRAWSCASLDNGLMEVGANYERLSGDPLAEEAMRAELVAS